jgi:hypothetical protein
MILKSCSISRKYFMMLALYSVFAALVYSFLPQVLCTPSNLNPRDLDSWVTAESAIALQGALNNIGPNGTKVAGAGAGFVVASPSKVNPDCKFLPPSTLAATNMRRLLHLESRLRSHIEDDH